MRMIRAYIQADGRDPPLTESAAIRASVRSEPTGTKRVFMSHKTGDYPQAFTVGNKLSRFGLSVYFVHDDPDVAPGDRDQLPSEVKSAMRHSNGLLVYASDNLVDLDASWVCFEVGLAEMRSMVTARYTVTNRSRRLLSPLRGLERVEKNLGVWANKVKRSKS